jgi:hypothetical protein
MRNEIIIPNPKDLSFDARIQVFRGLVDQAARRVDGNEEGDIRTLGDLIIDRHTSMTEAGRQAAQQKFTEALVKLSPVIEAQKEVEAAVGFITHAEGILLSGK